MIFKEAYKQYISSHLWRKKRKEFIETNHDTDQFRSCGDPNNCYRCDCCGWNFPINMIEVHHKHYHMQFGYETRKDVMVLCHNCHKEQDKIRERQGIERSRNALHEAIYMNRFIGWLRYKYGEDNINYYIDDDIEHELFQQFLESQED